MSPDTAKNGLYRFTIVDLPKLKQVTYQPVSRVITEMLDEEPLNIDWTQIDEESPADTILNAVVALHDPNGLPLYTYAANHYPEVEPWEIEPEDLILLIRRQLILSTVLAYYSDHNPDIVANLEQYLSQYRETYPFLQEDLPTNGGQMISRETARRINVALHHNLMFLFLGETPEFQDDFSSALQSLFTEIIVKMPRKYRTTVIELIAGLTEELKALKNTVAQFPEASIALHPESDAREGIDFIIILPDKLITVQISSRNNRKSAGKGFLFMNKAGITKMRVTSHVGTADSIKELSEHQID